MKRSTNGFSDFRIDFDDNFSNFNWRDAAAI